MKQEGRFQLQTRTDGVVDMIVVDFDAPDRVRAFARHDSARLAQAEADGKATSAELLGRGHLGFTIDPGGAMNRYQGVVALTGEGLERAAHDYFDRSEQIPTVVRLAVGEIVTGAGAHWRAGGLIVQFLPESDDRRRQADLHPGDAPEGTAEHSIDEDEAWTEGRALAGTVEDHELIDPSLSGERLLYRLFHERGVRVFAAQPVRDQCRCSTDSIRTMLKRFTRQERADMIGDDGRIGVTCEFCSTKSDPQEFDPKDLTFTISRLFRLHAAIGHRRFVSFATLSAGLLSKVMVDSSDASCGRQMRKPSKRAVSVWPPGSRVRSTAPPSPST